MMECAEYRKAILADPHHPTAQMRAHAASCRECSAYTERLMRFENRLERALRVDLQPAGSSLPLAGAGQGTRPWRRAPVRRVWAMAAGVMAVVLVAGSLWVSSLGVSLASDVVTHMAGEPGAWARTDIPVPPPQLSEVLRDSHMRLKPDAGMVSYANSCLFRGRRVPHLVLQTPSGPVTVMVLTDESVMRPVQFNEQGYRGVIVPVRHHGSLAVLERAPNNGAAVDEIAAQIRDAIDWTP